MGSITKEELNKFVEDKLSIRQIVKETDLSYTTIRYWLGKFGLKTKAYSGQISRDSSGLAIHSVIIRECKQHGLTEFGYEVSKRGYRCKRCRSQRVNDHRRKIKKILVEEHGGQCVRCGYKKSLWSLEFHHRDSLTKERELGHLIRDRKLEAARIEASKCDLVCSNCHGEQEESKWFSE